MRPGLVSGLGIPNFGAPFTAGYGGGRNESFLHGVGCENDERERIDYGLTGCYAMVNVYPRTSRHKQRHAFV